MRKTISSPSSSPSSAVFKFSKSFFVILFILLFSFFLYSFIYLRTYQIQAISSRNSHLNPQQGVEDLRDFFLSRKTSLNTEIQPTLMYIATPQPFLLFSPSPAKDQSNAVHLARSGVVSPKLTLLFYKLLSSTRSKGLVVDVGANMGYFTMMSALAGQRVIAFEPQKILVNMLSLSLSINNIEKNMVQIYNCVVGREKGKVNFIWDKSFWGHSRVISKQEQITEHPSNQSEEKMDIQSVGLKDIVDENIFILKVDVEGREMEVMSSAEELFQHHKIQNIFLEWKEVKNYHKEEGTRFLEKMIKRGYKIIEFHENYLEDISDDKWNSDYIFKQLTEVTVKYVTNEGKSNPKVEFVFPESNNIWLTTLDYTSIIKSHSH